MTRVKICCISSVEEAMLAVKYGASALGLVSAMPSGPGIIAENLITEIAERVPPGVASFLLTSKQTADEIIEQHRRCRTNTIQICDHLIDGKYSELKKALNGIKIVQVVHVTGEESLHEAVEVSKHVDAILLDSGNQKMEIKELGGTGRVHDWTISKKIRESISVPLYLAGGLKPDNVQDAIRNVNPFGLDLCSGVRTNGKLDKQKLSLFMQNVNSI